jgi:hypothetical protein
MKNRKSAGLILLLLAAASAVFAAEDYAILLTRPEKVGDRYRIDARGKSRQQQRISLGGKAAGNEDKQLEVHLVALATVLAVDEKLEASRVEYRVESCRQSSSGKTEEVVVPPGTKVLVESRNGETTFTVAGRPVPPEVEEALKVVISVHSSDSPTDDEVFGTHEHKRVGEKWGIHAADAAQNLSRSGLHVSADDLKGSVRLDGLRRLDAIQALEISAHLRADKISIDTPQGMRIESGLLEADLSGFVPVDTKSRERLSDKMQMRMSVRVGGQKPETGEKVTLEVSMELSIENNYSPAPESVEF